MSYFDADAREMLDIYILETKQLMDQMDEIMLDTEKQGRMSKEDIDSIFRIMHTAKSSAAMMGLETLSSMAHRLEDIFSVLRENPQAAEQGQKSAAELMLASSDFIKNELENMCREDYSPGKNVQLDAMIEEYAALVEGAQESPQLQEEDRLSVFMKNPGFILKVTFEEDCRMENVRAFMLMTQAKKICPSCKCFPSEPEKDQLATQYIIEHGFYLNFPAEKADELLPLLQGGLFVKSCELIRNSLPVPSVKEEERPGTDQTPEQNVQAPQEETQDSRAQKTMDLRTEFMNVKVERLDSLQNLTGELMILLSALNNSLEARGYYDLKEEYEYQIQRLLDELENTVIHMRMVPVARVIPKIKRILRDICKKENKEVVFEAYGQEIEADKNIVDRLSEAVMHIIRNAIDHGIEPPEERKKAGKPEQGRITLSAESGDGELVVWISDDGRGMDTGKILHCARERGMIKKPEQEYTSQELFEISMLPGFSTKDSATEYSGRGVGLDVVKKIAEDAGGHLRIKSEKGKGSSIIMHLPLTLTIVDSIWFYVGDCLFSLPSRQVCRFFQWGKENPALKQKDGKQVLMHEEALLSVIELGQLYGMGKSESDGTLIHVKGPTREACIRTDQIAGQGKIVLKPLPPLLGKKFRRETGITGCSIMGNGQICMALDAETVIRFALKEERHE